MRAFTAISSLFLSRSFSSSSCSSSPSKAGDGKFRGVARVDTREQPRILLLENDWMMEKGWASQQETRGTERDRKQLVMMSCGGSWIDRLAANFGCCLVEQLLHSIGWLITCYNQALCTRQVQFTYEYPSTMLNSSLIFPFALIVHDFTQN